MKNIRISPVAALFIGILAVSSASLLIRLAQEEAPSLVIAAYRMSLAAIVLFPFCIRNLIKEMKVISKTAILTILLSGIFLGFHFAVWVTSLEYTSVASSVVLVTTAPLWVALLSPLVLKEHLTRWIVLGLVISLAGSVIVALNSACSISLLSISCEGLVSAFKGKAFWGDLLALAGAWLSAGYLLMGRKVRGKVSLSSYVFLVYGTAAIVLLLLVAISRESMIGYSPVTYLWMVGLALIPQLVGHSVFNWSLKYLSAAFVSIALLGEPIGTIILTRIFLGEKPAILELVGGGLILLGIFFATRTAGEKTAVEIEQGLV